MAILLATRPTALSPVSEADRRRSHTGRSHRGRSGALRARWVRRKAPQALERLALDVRQVLRALDVEDGLLVGHSMGGMVAVQAVSGMSPEERHKRLSGLVLTSTTTGPFLEIPGWDLFASLGSPAVLRAVAGFCPLRAWGDSERRHPLVGEPSRLRRRGPSRSGQVLGSDARGGRAGHDGGTSRAALARANLASVLPSVDIPTLITIGTHDRLTPPRHSRRLESKLPDARLVELARCGHMPMLERRREFDRLLEEHARKVS